MKRRNVLLGFLLSIFPVLSWAQVSGDYITVCDQWKFSSKQYTCVHLTTAVVPNYYSLNAKIAELETRICNLEGGTSCQSTSGTTQVNWQK
jgi:hypothetical protein